MTCSPPPAIILGGRWVWGDTDAPRQLCRREEQGFWEFPGSFRGGGRGRQRNPLWEPRVGLCREVGALTDSSFHTCRRVQPRRTCTPEGRLGCMLETHPQVVMFVGCCLLVL